MQITYRPIEANTSVDPERHTNRIIAQMQRLRSSWSRHIECFDNSIFQGTNR
jgi:hypothetical protein